MLYHNEQIVSDPTLSAEEKVQKIFCYPAWKNPYGDDSTRLNAGMADSEGDSLAQLVEWYENRNSHKVQYAAKQLKKAFLGLPPVEQRRVGIALLKGRNASDAEWVCRRLGWYYDISQRQWSLCWHPCYAPFVEECWNRFHGRYCGLLLVQFLDEEIVRRNLDTLQGDNFYFSLCRRFAGNPWLKVERERIKSSTTISSYLMVMAKTQEGISASEARALLFQWVGVFVGLDRMYVRQNFWSSRRHMHRTIFLRGMATAIFYLLEMHQDDVVTDFLRWDEKVFDDYMSSIAVENDSRENAETFIQKVMSNFPEDLLYFTRLDGAHYQFIDYRSECPYVVPQLLLPPLFPHEHLQPYLPASNVNASDEASEHLIEERKAMDPGSESSAVQELISRLHLAPV